MAVTERERLSQFFEWLVKIVSSAQLSELYQAFIGLDEALLSGKYYHHFTGKIEDTTDIQALENLHKELRRNDRLMPSYQSGVKLSALRYYIRFIQEHSNSPVSPQPEQDLTEDVLIARLKKEQISYVDNRPKNGALWIPDTLRTKLIIREFETMGVHFEYSATKKQWWTRDASPKSSTVQVDDPQNDKQKKAFVTWLEKQNMGTTEVFTLYGSARKIHKIISAQGFGQQGLFGIRSSDQARNLIQSVSTNAAYVRVDKAESHYLTKAFYYYIKFLESTEKMNRTGETKVQQKAEKEPIPQKPQGKPLLSEMREESLQHKTSENPLQQNSQAEPLPQRAQVTPAQQKIQIEPAAREARTSEESLCQWLKQEKPAQNEDEIIRIVRMADQFAQRNHLYDMRLLGVQPFAARVAINRLVAYPSFMKNDARTCREFRRIAPFLLTYVEYLNQPAKPASETVAKKVAENNPVPIESRQPIPQDQPIQKKTTPSPMDSALAEMLQEDVFADLRNALIAKGILTVEEFRKLNLWVFMNQNSLYSIGMRYTVYNRLNQLQKQAEKAEQLSALLYQLKSSSAVYCGATPAEAFLHYCETISQKVPLGFRVLIGLREPHNDRMVLSSKRLAADDLQLKNPTAYIDAHLDADTALHFAQFVGELCRDNNTPTSIEKKETLKQKSKEKVPAVQPEAALSLEEFAAIYATDSMEADLTADHDYSDTKPVYFLYKGVRKQESAWQDLYLDVCQLLYRDYKQAIRSLADNPAMFGVASYFAKNSDKIWLRSPVSFASGLYIESGLSATEIMKRIRKLRQHFGLGDQLVIYYQPAKNATPIQQKPEAKPAPVAPPSPPPSAPPAPRPPLQPIKPAPTSAPNSGNSLQSRVEKAVLQADLAGLTLDRLYGQFPMETMASLRQIRDESPRLVEMPDGRLVHVDAFVDLEEAADKLQEILEKLLDKNNGYVSSVQLFEYARSEMQMFLNDNDMGDERSVYAIAKHFFEKVKWHGQHYVFSSGSHISRGGEEALSSNMDVIRKYVRDQDGFFVYDDLVEYLEQVGIKTGNLRGQMQMGLKPNFFYYSSDHIISAESMNIDDAWLEQTKQALKRLFDDVGDHIVLRGIAAIWYEQLPTLPGYKPWTPLLLQNVLQFYGKQLGARTIHSELNQKYDVVHAMLVTTNSVIQTFADTVVAYLVILSKIKRHRLYARCIVAGRKRSLIKAQCV